MIMEKTQAKIKKRRLEEKDCVRKCAAGYKPKEGVLSYIKGISPAV
jgi:hypothetical protein